MLIGLPTALVILTVPEVSGQRVTGQSAAEAFSRGDYMVSYERFSALIESFPRDPVYLYGAAVSLVKLSLRPGEASELLERSLKNGSSIRSAPADVPFYLGRAYHLQGRFDEATDAYNLFVSEAGRREARSYGVPDLLKQCTDKIGSLSVNPETEMRTPAKVEEDPRTEPATMVRQPDLIEAGRDSLLKAALTARFLSDSLSGVAKKLEGTPLPGDQEAREKNLEKIRELKFLSMMSQRLSDSLLAVAGLTVSGEKIPDPASGIISGASSDLSRIALSKDSAARVLPVNVEKRETIIVADSAGKADTVVIEAGEPDLKQVTKAVTSIFSLNDSPYYSVDVPVKVSSSWPEGFYYSIQLAVFRNPVAPSFFKRLFPVFGIRNPGSQLTTYYTGLFRKSDDASMALQSVNSEGFRDAFIVIYFDGRQVSPERGALLEKEWGGRALTAWDDVIPKDFFSPVQRDTVPPTLLFRVEVLRTKSPVTEQQHSEILRIAADRGLEIMNPSTGLYVYLVGKFLTFESASSYADLLIRNGYREARVAAWLGNREIPVETALKFFNR